MNIWAQFDLTCVFTTNPEHWSKPPSLIFFYSKLTPSPLHYEFKIKTIKLAAFILLILYQWYMKYPIDINFQQGYNITTSWIYSITKYPDNISGASAARESRFNVLMFWGYVRSKPPSWERWNVRKRKVHPYLHPKHSVPYIGDINFQWHPCNSWE